MARLRPPEPCAVESRFWDALLRTRKPGRLALPEHDDRLFNTAVLLEQISLPSPTIFCPAFSKLLAVYTRSGSGSDRTFTSSSSCAMKDKIVTADEAVALTRDGDSVCCSGFVGIGTPDELIMALERRFTGAGEPRNLTLVFTAAPGDGRDRGLNRLALPGLVKRAIGGHWALLSSLV